MNPISLIRSTARKILSVLLVTVLCFISNLNFAQVKKAPPGTPLPFVSDEVFLAIAQFLEYDRNIPFDAKVISKDKFAGSKREKIIFTGVNNSQVPAYLLIPNNGSATHPIVFLVDGIYGSKERWVEDNNWPKGGLVTKALLKNGFAVMTLDAVYHGERAFENDYARPPWPLTFPYKGRHMFLQTAIEYRRAIDYISTRDDVDADRIGMMGLSMGGLITFNLTAVDTRIKSAAAGLTPVFKAPEFQSWIPSTYASRIQCDSFLMFMGDDDPFYTMKEARELFELIPVSQKKFVEYNVKHEPPIEYVEMVANWFLQNLKL